MADPATEPQVDPSVPGASPIDELVTEAARALQKAEPSAFLVLPRVLRRVIKQEWELPTLTVQVPHRKSWIIARNQLIKHVNWDELGLEPNSNLPDRSILIARPDDKRLESMTIGELKLQIWRLLFHARIHLEFEKLRESGQMQPADFRARIDGIGQVEFDEIVAVLKRENFLRVGASPAETYMEFAAVYCEFRKFQPHCLATYFPSFEDFEHVDRLLAQDVDVDGLFVSTRLDGGLAPEQWTGHVETFEELPEVGALLHHSLRCANAVADKIESATPPRNTLPASLVELAISQLELADRPTLRVFSKLIRRADKAFAGGNAVGAALLQMQAARYAPPELVRDAVSGALTDIQRLAQRLQAALGFDHSALATWYESLVGLLIHASHGFWNADKKLLYDLQKVCVDHEREISTVDLLGFIKSLGKRPVKRALPNQREVLMSKHLRSATRRLVAARLTGEERQRLSILLHEAAESAEHQMRTRLRPLTEQALRDVQFVPTNVPEQVSFNKLVEELLDSVVVRGFVTMGDLRDAISRSNLKLADLSGPGEFLRGDLLLQADKRLSILLDGVYQRGDIHLRWLQRLSAASFGTEVGRFLTRFAVIPYGAAFLCFQAIVHIIEKVADHESPVITWIKDRQNVWSTVAFLGTLLLLIIHVRPFRKLLSKLLLKSIRVVRRICYEWPVRFLRQPVIRRLLKSLPATLFRKYALIPSIPTAIICWLIPVLNEWPQQPIQNWIVVWAAMAVILNSRVGRDVEELTTEWVHHTWHRIRVHVFVALFDLVMESFKRLLEWFERVLYAVDEWLRFKSGETSVSFGLKAILGVFWAAFTFVARFCVNLLIEPQINPIKHFPVVTVSHKLILPLGIPGGFLSELIEPIAGSHANAIAGTTVFLIPGIFGFLVWELKSNWRLYMANRGEHLQPVLVGSHGETFIRLMKPGFHSGTLPKLFAKLRRVDRHRHGSQHSLPRTKYLDQLHHVQIAVQHFVERELLQLLDLSADWPAHKLSVGRLRLASNNVRIEIACPHLAPENLVLLFEEQSGWLVAGTSTVGWARMLSDKDRRVLHTALIGFYRLAGVDLVREQIAETFAANVLPYDVAEEGLVVWPDGRYEEEAVYNLRQWPWIRPYPRPVATSHSLPTVNAENLVFGLTRLSWDVWARQWDQAVSVKPPVLPEHVTWRWPQEASNGQSTRSA